MCLGFAHQDLVSYEGGCDFSSFVPSFCGASRLGLAFREAQQTSDGHWGGLSTLEVRTESAKWLLGFPFHLMEGRAHSPDKLVTEAVPGRV